MFSKKYFQKLLIISFCTILILGCKSNGQNDYSNVITGEQLEHINKENIDRGKLFDDGYILEIKEVKRIKLDTSQEGFISSLTDIKLYGNSFYAVDGMSPEVLVFEINGEYKKTINIKPAPKKGCFYSNLLKTGRETFLLKNAKNSEIIEFDYLGQVQRKYFISDDKVKIYPVGLDFIETNMGLEVYSATYQNFDEEFDRLSDRINYALKNTLLVGKFDENGTLVAMFIKHNPIYSEYSLSKFQPVYFKIWDNKLFLIEQALPFIRIFTLDGKLIHSFGTPGLHMKPIEKQPRKRLGVNGTNKFYSKHTAFDGIEIIGKIRNLNYPVIAIEYFNPVYKENGENEISLYLMLYSEDGELLYNDIEIPGALYQITENSRLLIVLDHSPDNLVIGLFELLLTK